MHFLCALEQNKMQTVSSKLWSYLPNIILCYNNHYAFIRLILPSFCQQIQYIVGIKKLREKREGISHQLRTPCSKKNLNINCSLRHIFFLTFFKQQLFLFFYLSVYFYFISFYFSIFPGFFNHLSPGSFPATIGYHRPNLVFKSRWLHNPRIKRSLTYSRQNFISAGHIFPSCFGERWNPKGQEILIDKFLFCMAAHCHLMIDTS